MLARHIRKRTIWSSIKNSWNNISLDVEPIVLYRPTSLSNSSSSSTINWKPHSDIEYGGSSIGNLQEINDGENSFLRYSGSLNFVSVSPPKDSTDEVSPSKIAKAGYCAIKGEFRSVQDLRDMEGIEIVIKSQYKQSITFSMSCRSFLDGEIFQVDAAIPSDNVCRLQFPFKIFRSTVRGQELEYQRENDDLQVEGLGFLLKGFQGPFQLDIFSIRALPVLENFRKPQRVSPNKSNISK